MKTLDLESWKRRSHYEFFRTFDKPFFNICAEVDVTTVTVACRRPGGPSFFLATLHCSLGAANAVEEFRLRIRGDEVVLHEVIHGGSTVLMPDETFAFAYVDYDPDFDRFQAAGRQAIEVTRQGAGGLDNRSDQDAMIHYSVIPWVAFTSFSHARRFGTEDSVPKIVFGKRHSVGERQLLPVSVEVHHALVDGLHVGRFFEGFQGALDGWDARG